MEINENLVISENLLNLTEYSTVDYRQLVIAYLSQQALIISNPDIFIKNLIDYIHKTLKPDIIFNFKLEKSKNRLKNFNVFDIKYEDSIPSFIDIEKNDFFEFLLNNDNNPVLVRNFENDTRFNKRNFFYSNNIRSGIGFTSPMKFQQIVVLCLFFKDEKVFSLSDISFIHSISFILSLAITEYVRKTKLKVEEENSKIILEYSSEAIILFNLDGTIIKANSKACSLTDFSKEDLLTKKIEDLYIPSEKNLYQIYITKLKKSRNLIFKRQVLKKNGQQIIAEVNAHLLPNGLVQCFYKDLKVRKENDELIRIAQRMEAIGRVSGGIAHDFNNYLSVIMGYLEKILKDDYDINNAQSIKNDLFHVKKTVEKASILVKELLNFSDKKIPTSEIININEMLNEMKNPIQNFVGEKTLIVYELEKNISMTSVNQNKLWRSILNLIINAKYSIDFKSPNKPCIKVKTFNFTLEDNYLNYSFNALPGDYVGISITDNGIGLSEFVKSHLFEPFFTTKNLQNGSGLGLSSIYSFIRSIDGFMTIDSNESKFAEFTICLKKFTGKDKIKEDK